MSDGATVDHVKVMKQTMNYALHTRERGLHLQPEMIIANPLIDLFIIKGRSDRNHATNVETRKVLAG